MKGNVQNWLWVSLPFVLSLAIFLNLTLPKIG